MGMGLLTDKHVKYGEYKIQTLKGMVCLAPQNVRFGVLCQRLVLWIQYFWMTFWNSVEIPTRCSLVIEFIIPKFF